MFNITNIVNTYDATKINNLIPNLNLTNTTIIQYDMITPSPSPLPSNFNVTIYNDDIIYNNNVNVTEILSNNILPNSLVNNNIWVSNPWIIGETTPQLLLPFYYSPYIYYNKLLLNNEKNRLLTIPNVGSKNIPSNSADIITFEDIIDGDILIDFLRDTKTEYEYGAYYKETTFNNIMKSGKNQFTLTPIDQKTVIKYKANII